MNDQTPPELRWLWIGAELLLAATAISSVFMLQRVFADDSYAAPLVFTVIVSHVVLITMRWFGFGTFATGVVSFAATTAAIVAIHYPTSAIGAIVPTGATLDQLQIDMTQAQDAFQSLQSPVPPITGFLVAASVALWFISVTADWAAFRLFAPGQAVIPFVGLLVFVSMLGVDEARVRTTAVALVFGVLFLLAHRAASRAIQGIWLDQGPGRGYVALLGAGAVVAAVASVAGLMGGPLVPGADEAPLVEIGDESNEENKPLEVVSPLVQIQPRLVDQSDRVLFTVDTNERAYWRIAALDVFDGVLWRSQGQFRSANDDLPVEYPSRAPVNIIEATFDLSDLNVVWAPAAYLPTDFENLTEAGVNYEAESATFIVDTKDQDESDGLRYRVTSQVPTFTPETLTRLAAESNESIDQRYLELPDGFSPLARQTAVQITAGITDPYQQALALQNYFRDNFTYDLEVAKGHDIRRVDDFLNVQRGYCEQFAGTYASMARAIGLPARVATGFTPGDPDPLIPGRYLVKGKHAHAWPEVFIAGAGWVAFEPTPGRGAPNATEYTGVPESQDSFEGANVSEDPADALTQPAQAEPAAPQPTPTPLAATPQPTPTPTAAEQLAAAELADGSQRSYRTPLLIAAVVMAWIVGVPLLKRWRVNRRRDRIGTDTRRRTTLAWATTVDHLEVRHHGPLTDETLSEFAARVQKELPRIHPAFGELTELAVEAAYRPRLPDASQAERAEQLAASVSASLNANQPWPLRGATELDPRPLLRISDPVAQAASRLAEGAGSKP